MPISAIPTSSLLLHLSRHKVGFLASHSRSEVILRSLPWTSPRSDTFFHLFSFARAFFFIKTFFFFNSLSYVFFSWPLFLIYFINSSLFHDIIMYTREKSRDENWNDEETNDENRAVKNGAVSNWCEATNSQWNLLDALAAIIAIDAASKSLGFPDLCTYSFIYVQLFKDILNA